MCNILEHYSSWWPHASHYRAPSFLGECFEHPQLRYLPRIMLPVKGGTPQNQQRIGGESALPIVVPPLRGACNNPHCIIRMQLGPQWSSWSRGEGARGEIAFRTDGATANPGDNLFLCGRSRKTRKTITKKPDAFARPIFFIFLE